MADRRERIKVLLYRFQENDQMKKLVDDSVARACGISAARFTIINVPDRAPALTDLSGVDAVIIGGAKWSVFEEVPNQAELIEVIKAAREKKIPTFGICYGAQLLAHALGGEVVRDAENAEWGTFEMETSDDSFTDIIFADVPFKFPAQCAHRDRIAKLPPAAIPLAFSKKCSIQAFTIPGADIYGVQFHPERSKSDYEAILEERGKNYAGDLSSLEAIRATLAETPDAESILTKFFDRIVLQR